MTVTPLPRREPDRPSRAGEGAADDVVCVVGGGYVGIVTAASLARDGRWVRVLERDPRRCAELNAGQVSLCEPGLDELVAAGHASGHLIATEEAAVAMRGAGMAIIAVGTPPLSSGGADLDQVRTALSAVAAYAEDTAVLVLKSSVPPGTTLSMQGLARRGRRRLPLIVCPEFLSEGHALRDFEQPARLVVGGEDADACRRVVALFARPGHPVLITDATSAEMIKYGSNTFLALKISFINEIAHLCELTGADIDVVADGLGADPRIGRDFLSAGVGFGGSCFPKDMGALQDIAGRHDHSFWLLRAAVEVNIQQRYRVVRKVTHAVGGLTGKRIAVLGLAFKPGTDDVRQAPAQDVISHLENGGALVSATDPLAVRNAADIVGPATVLVDDPYECVRSADAVVVLTEWPEYRQLDWARIGHLMRRRNVIDARNCLPAADLVALGFSYAGMGRRVVPAASRRRAIAKIAAAPGDDMTSGIAADL